MRRTVTSNPASWRVCDTICGKNQAILLRREGELSQDKAVREVIQTLEFGGIAIVFSRLFVPDLITYGSQDRFNNFLNTLLIYSRQIIWVLGDGLERRLTFSD